MLAAGSASRFGATKQLAELDGVPLVRHAVNVAAEACGDNTVLVLGHDWNAIADACAPLTGFMVINDDYADGQGSSIATAVRSLRHVARAIIVLLADQPMITAEHVQALRDTWNGADDELVATVYADTVGVPVLFPRGCFEELCALQDDTGGRHLLTDKRFGVQRINFEPAAVDIDTPEDLKQISRSARS